MTRPLLACAVVAPLVLGLGCKVPNPAFNADNGGGDGTVGNSDTSPATSTGGSSGEGDGDGDPFDTGSTAPDEGADFDLPPDACMVETTIGLRPHFGAPEQFQGVCDDSINKFVQVVGSDDLGNWYVTVCGEGCLDCPDSAKYTMGAQALELATLLPPVQLDPNQPQIGCYFVQAGPLVPVENENNCVYGSLSIHTLGGPDTPLLFNANRDNWGLTSSAFAKTFGWEPEILDQGDAAQCACEELEIECCPGHSVIAKKFGLGNNVFVYPGDQANVLIAEQEMTFYGVQAQSGTTCEPEPETSWAIALP